MACEVPVVASNVGGIPEVIEHGVSGMLHPPDALDEMADSVLALVQDEPRRRQMGQAARRRACELFNVDDIVSRYEAYYREVLG